MIPALLLTGCVQVYQPMSGLHRPVVVNTQLANFHDLAVTVRCVPEDLLAEDAGLLCQKVGTLLENQGAKVSTTTSAVPDPVEVAGLELPAADGALDLPGLGGDLDAPDGTTTGGEGSAPRTGQADGPGAVAAPGSRLAVELRARQVHKANNLLSWAICIASFTLVPAVTETTFAQDVVVRDADGFLLVSDSLEGRLINRFGAGPWIGNALMNVGIRDPEDRLTADTVRRDLSTDLYRQLSQLVFNAEMQGQVLRQIPTGRGN
ncbi:MAG: hypothetical protein ABMB14_17205 [Myxococcota bacterium]